VKDYQTKGRRVIIVGDLNIAHNPIDSHQPDEESAGFYTQEREWFTSLLNEDFVDSFRYLNPSKRQYTWWDPVLSYRFINKGWRLDYIIVSTDLLEILEDSSILTEQMGSDHCPTLLKLSRTIAPSGKIVPMSSEYNRKYQSSILSFVKKNTSNEVNQNLSTKRPTSSEIVPPVKKSKPTPIINHSFESESAPIPETKNQEIT